MDRELDAFLSGHIYIEDDMTYKKKAAFALVGEVSYLIDFQFLSNIFERLPTVILRIWGN